MPISLNKLSAKELAALRSQLEQRQAELQKQTLDVLREKVFAMIEKEGLTVDEVLGTKTRARAAGRRSKAAVPKKYRNPKSPHQEWSGRGRQPAWFAEAIASGTKEQSLLIK
ncbi:H-NS histone family protein [Dokdonella sp. MW10]|uniref:H-NS histone family protein n=1 Tax=Dokdonella sp. MW10 TaxID=2992926 RepID=UPI003F7CE2EA